MGVSAVLALSRPRSRMRARIAAALISLLSLSRRVQAAHIAARCTARGPSRSSLIRLAEEPPPLPPLSISPEKRHEQWELMQQNFGCRWEGQTGWFTPAGRELVRASSEPLAAVYQLEFPRDQPEIGAWRGWGVGAPGDERTVPLSEASVIERQRQQGSATFQFPGAGGRCPLRLGQIWAAEVNFFHGDHRCGLVMYLQPPEGDTDAPDNPLTARDGDGDAAATKPSASIMAMSFRKAPISADGNLTFVKGGEPTLRPPHGFGSATPANARAAAASTLARRQVMYVEDYTIQSERTGIRRPGTAAVEGLTGGARLRVSLPDGVWCCVPGEWPLEGGARFTFGCDFRPMGGPERVVTMEYRGAQLVRWVCEDRVQ